MTDNIHTAQPGRLHSQTLDSSSSSNPSLTRTQAQQKTRHKLEGLASPPLPTESNLEDRILEKCDQRRQQQLSGMLLSNQVEADDQQHAPNRSCTPFRSSKVLYELGFFPPHLPSLCSSQRQPGGHGLVMTAMPPEPYKAGAQRQQRQPLGWAGWW